ncbi:C-type lectin domain family 4 member D-like [Phoenicopterus ruber ruber]
MHRRGRVSPGTAAPAEERSCSWLNPWIFLVSVLAIKTAFVTVCLVVFLHGSSGQYNTLLQKFTEWSCVLSVSGGKKEGWTCCPKGWKYFEEKCCYLSSDTMSWDDSEQNCTGMGSHLVVVNSAAEQEFLSNELKGSNGRNLYIGLRAKKVGQWHWVDQTPFNETAAFWRHGEPSNKADQECVVIHADSDIHNWNDVKCASYHRICEAAAVTV